MRQSLWVWCATCVLGFGYWLTALGRSGIAFQELALLPAAVQVPWKGACTLGLAASVFLAGHDRSTRLVSAALFISAIADMILALKLMVVSGVLFSFSHLIAIYVFRTERLPKPTPARVAAAICVPALSFGLAILAIRGTEVPLVFALYPLLSGIMASMAILSRYPLWLTGFGAAVFICSDVLVLAWLGVFEQNPRLGFLTWLTYFAGYAMLARGVAKKAVANAPA